MRRRILFGALALLLAGGTLWAGRPAVDHVAQAEPELGEVAAAPKVASSAGTQAEWLGWSHFRFTTTSGRVILTNPFTNNPDSPLKAAEITRADAILVPDGHGDEVGQTGEIAPRTGARVLATGGVMNWLVEQGVPQAQVTRSNPGSRINVAGVTVRPLNAIHGSELPAPTLKNPSGGQAISFMITFEDGWTVYFGGSGAATTDMALWAQMYKPHAAILVMSGNTEPMDFAMSVKLLQTDNPNLTTVIPHHHRVVQPPGTTTIGETQMALDAMGLGIQLTVPEIGRPWNFTVPAPAMAEEMAPM